MKEKFAEILLVVVFRFAILVVPLSALWLSGEMTGGVEDYSVKRVALMMCLLVGAAEAFDVISRAVKKGAERRLAVAGIGGLLFLFIGILFARNASQVGTNIGLGLIAAGLFEILRTVVEAITYLLVDDAQPGRVIAHMRKLNAHEGGT